MAATPLLGWPMRGLTSVLLFSLFRATYGFAQYCHEPVPDARFPFCMAVDARLNVSSSSTDITVTFGYQKNDLGGWAAIGQGSGMYGALMFILYADTALQNEAYLSVRRGKGHFEPRPELLTSLVETLSVTSNQSGWVEASFDCYGCGNGYEESEPQPWIWSANTNQQLDDASVESTLDLHDYYGRFTLVLPRPHDKSRTIPIIDQSLPNQQESQSSGYSMALEEKHALFHGALVTVSVAFLFPMGMLIMKARVKISLRLHLLLQLTGSVGCLLGCGFAITKLEKPFPLFEPHVLIGSLVVCAIMLQPLLGWIHHRGFTKGIQTPRATTGHIWLGRLIIIAGCVNAAIGLHMRSASIIYVTYFSALAVIWALASVYLSNLSPRSVEEEKEVTEPFLH